MATKSDKNARPRTVARIVAAPLVEIFGLSWKLAFATVVFVVLVLAGTVFWSVHTTPPRRIIITSGPPGSVFETNAIKYSNVVWRITKGHVKVKVLNSQGALENLERLDNHKFKVDVGFVQGGITNGVDADGNSTNTLASLGGVWYQPLLVFYHGSNTVSLLSEFAGKRLAIGPVGSGTRALALTLLKANGIEPGGPTQLMDLDAEEAAKALLADKIDGIFMMGDSAPTAVLRQLLHTPEIQLMDFAQADGYARRITYLNHMDMPRGAMDFGKDIPPHDVRLVGPTVELIARPTLHPALSDLLLEAAQEVNGSAGIFRRQGEFPSLEEHDFPVSQEAQRYHKKGKTLLYEILPFWLAALVEMVAVAFVPALVVVIPALKLIPTIYKWRIRLIFYKWYRALMVLERQLSGPVSRERMKELIAQLDEIEAAVNKMKVPASFAGDYYGLRGHVDFVRERLTEGVTEPVV